MTEAAPDQVNGHDKKADAELDKRAMKIARATLTGDVRDLILKELKDTKNGKPWDTRGELDQMKTIAEVKHFAETIVERVVEIVAAGGRKVMRAKLGKITINDGVKADLEISAVDEERHKFFDAQGRYVSLIVADPADFTGERAPVAINKQQKEMALDGAGQGKETPLPGPEAANPNPSAQA